MLKDWVFIRAKVSELIKAKKFYYGHIKILLTNMRHATKVKKDSY